MISKIIGYGIVECKDEDISKIPYVYDIEWHCMFHDPDNDNKLTLRINSIRSSYEFTNMDIFMFDNSYDKEFRDPVNVGNFRKMSEDKYMFDIWGNERLDDFEDDPLSQLTTEIKIGTGIVEIWNFNLFEYWSTYMRNIDYSYLLRFREGYNKNYGSLQAIFHIFGEACYPENVVSLFLKPEYQDVDLDLRIIKNIRWIPNIKFKNPLRFKFDITNKRYNVKDYMEFADKTFSTDPTI